ncbi:hypothetical protein CSB37_01915 [bacterium DOLZORAL124_38_8]|nr:MAG: hypothetical protein CSB37_01915 [bacterium DOLZORAL124_38_8]
MKIDWLKKPKKRISLSGMDSLRGLAALLVFGFHFWGIFLRPTQTNTTDIFGFLTAGHLGVDMFFVLSGLLITLSFISTQNIRQYFSKRIRRIVPLAWTCLIILFLIFQNFSLSAIKDFWVHLGFGQSLIHEFYHGLNPVMWTLTVEMIFYLFLPLAFWIGRKKQWIFWTFLSTLLVANFGYRYWVQDLFPVLNWSERVFVSEQFWGRFDQFFYGILLAFGVLYQQKLPNLLKKNSLLWISLGLATMLLGFKLFAINGSAFRESIWLQVGLHSLFGLGFTLFLWGGILRPQPKPNHKSTYLEYLGKISYGIYLWHFVILEATEKLTTNPITAGVISLCVTIVVSQLSWDLIEKPFLKQRKST